MTRRFKQLLTDRKILSWALYDWANSAFSTTVVAGFFPIFYSHLSKDIPTSESQFWFNIALTCSSLLVAIFAPILGAIADRGGGKKRFLATFAMLGIFMCFGLAWVQEGMWQFALIIYAIGQVGFSGANIFYDAMIVDVSEDDELDMVSGYGYALGYIGGGLLFLLNVLMVTKPALFGLESTATALSLSFVSVGIWWGAFTIPLMMTLRSTSSIQKISASEAIKQGWVQLIQTFHEIRSLKVVFLFLAGYWLYIDGVGSVIKLAVFFANRILELPQDSLITALLITQFVAFPSALFFGWLGKRIGPKNAILIAIVVYIGAILYAWGWLNSGADFYNLAVTIGLVQGGIQSLSRSLFARIIPDNKTAEFFGFFNMVGKFASIFGPLMMAFVPLMISGMDERDSILVLVPLFLFGGIILLWVDVEAGVKAAEELEQGN